MSSAWSVPRDWPGETVAVLAGGPSLTGAQGEACRGRCRVIAVNNAGIDTQDSKTKAWIPAIAPWADVLFAADAKWWHAYKDRALKFEGLKVTIKPNPWPEIKLLSKSPRVGYDPDPRYLSSGGNSGYMAICLAAHFGAARVILLGFDMREGPGHRRHYFGDHPPRLNSRPAFSMWLNAFRVLAPALQKRGIEVINATPKSALTCFKRMTLEEALRAASRPIATPSYVPAASAAAGP